MSGKTGERRRETGVRKSSFQLKPATPDSRLPTPVDSYNGRLYP